VYHDARFTPSGRQVGKATVSVYAESKDLVHWSQPVQVSRFLPIKLPQHLGAGSLLDPLQKNFAIFWSSSFGDGEGNHIFVTRTADGKTFSEAKPFLIRDLPA